MHTETFWGQTGARMCFKLSGGEGLGGRWAHWEQKQKLVLVHTLGGQAVGLSAVSALWVVFLLRSL